MCKIRECFLSKLTEWPVVLTQSSDDCGSVHFAGHIFVGLHFSHSARGDRRAPSDSALWRTRSIAPWEQGSEAGYGTQA